MLLVNWVAFEYSGEQMWEGVLHLELQWKISRAKMKVKGGLLLNMMIAVAFMKGRAACSSVLLHVYQES